MQKQRFYISMWTTKGSDVTAATHHNTVQNAVPRSNAVQCTVTQCNALQHTATYCNTLQHAATPDIHSTALQVVVSTVNRLLRFPPATATHCNALQHTLQYAAPHCNTLQYAAPHCNTLQHTATHCNTLQLAHTWHPPYCLADSCVYRQSSPPPLPFHCRRLASVCLCVGVREWVCVCACVRA